MKWKSMRHFKIILLHSKSDDDMRFAPTPAYRDEILTCQSELDLIIAFRPVRSSHAYEQVWDKFSTMGSIICISKSIKPEKTVKDNFCFHLLVIISFLSLNRIFFSYLQPCIRLNLHHRRKYVPKFRCYVTISVLLMKVFKKSIHVNIWFMYKEL